MVQECDKELIAYGFDRSMYKPKAMLGQWQQTLTDLSSPSSHRRLLLSMGCYWVLPRDGSLARISLHGVDLQRMAPPCGSLVASTGAKVCRSWILAGCLRLLPGLRVLILSRCNLTHVPDAVRLCYLLHGLHLADNPLETVPKFLFTLCTLNVLHLAACRSLANLEQTTLKHSCARGDLERIGGLVKEAEYRQGGRDQVRQLQKSLEHLMNLQTLDLSRYFALEHLPNALCKLNNLLILDLSMCPGASAA